MKKKLLSAIAFAGTAIFASSLIAQESNTIDTHEDKSFDENFTPYQTADKKEDVKPINVKDLLAVLIAKPEQLNQPCEMIDPIHHIEFSEKLASKQSGKDLSYIVASLQEQLTAGGACVSKRLTNNAQTASVIFTSMEQNVDFVDLVAASFQEAGVPHQDEMKDYVALLQAYGLNETAANFLMNPAENCQDYDMTIGELSVVEARMQEALLR